MKFRKLFLLLIFISCFFFVKTGVNAITDGSKVNTKSGGSCQGSNCYTNDIGVRITVVNEDGDRCEYRPSDNKIICGGNVSKYSHSHAKSIDYWFVKDSNDSITRMDPCKMYEYKTTKKEFISPTNGLKKDDYVGACKDYDVDSSTIVSLFGKELHKIKADGDSEWQTKKPDGSTVDYDEDDIPSNSIEYVRNPENFDRIINYLECTMLSDASKKFGTNDNLKSSYCGSVEKDSSIMERIFRNAFETNALDISSLKLEDQNKKKIYLQFEQIVAFTSYKGIDASGPLDPAQYTFAGTVTEVAYMYQNYSGVSLKRWALISDGRWFNNGIKDIKWNSTAAICTGIFDGWSNNVPTGTGLEKTVTTSRPSCTSKPLLNPGFSLDRYWANDTRNVVSFWVNPEGIDDCNTDARNEDLIKTYGNITNFISYLKGKYSDDYENTNRNNNKINIFEAIKDNFHTGINKILSSSVIRNGDYCKAISCEDILDGLKKSEQANEDNLNILHSTFNNNDYIDPEFLKEMGITNYNNDIVSCKPAPQCPVRSSKLHCENKDGNSLTLSDSDAKDSSGESCISQGIAYNGLTTDDENFIKKSTQTSYDRTEYGTANDPGYCKESVSFSFPGNASTKAGKLLKWGFESDTADSTFGTMTITRECHLSDDMQTKNFITSYWADVEGKPTVNTSSKPNGGRINPQFDVYYKQAIPSSIDAELENEIVEGNLKVYLSKFEMSDNSPRNSGRGSDKGFDYCNSAEYDIIGNLTNKDDFTVENGCANNNPRTITCPENGGCGGVGISDVTMTATYQIYYDNNLYWYSDKSAQFALQKGDNLSDIDNPSYVAVGYGLPTSFVTPSSPPSGYGYSLSSENSDAKLSVTVSNIGTRNDTGGYHFDKMIEFALEDDDPSNTNSIVYSCGFNIQNELFGYECGDHGEKCSSTCDGPNCDPSCPNGICDAPKGIDVVFRTVDLISSENDIGIAFPGRSGNGRERGRNWAEIADSDVAQILRNDVYSNDPMYELTLDAGTIQRIREYNRQLTYPYTDMAEEDENYGSEGNGYEGYTFYKDDSTGQTTVASNFIKYLIDEEKITGRCAIGSNTDRIKSIITGCGRDD